MPPTRRLFKGQLYRISSSFGKNVLGNFPFTLFYVFIFTWHFTSHIFISNTWFIGVTINHKHYCKHFLFSLGLKCSLLSPMNHLTKSGSTNRFLHHPTEENTGRYQEGKSHSYRSLGFGHRY